MTESLGNIEDLKADIKVLREACDVWKRIAEAESQISRNLSALLIEMATNKGETGK